MDGRTEIRTDRPSPDGRPTSTRRPKDERLKMIRIKDNQYKELVGQLALGGQKMKD